MDNSISYILPFKFKYLPALQELHRLRNNALNVELTMKDLPKIGCVAFMGKQCIAAGFLRRVEPTYGQLDTFLTYPYCGSLIRHDALTKVTDFLLEEAQDLGLTGLLVITKSQEILERAKTYGFEVVEHKTLYKSL